jgi:hypothetical protein
MLPLRRYRRAVTGHSRHTSNSAIATVAPLSNSACLPLPQLQMHYCMSAQQKVRGRFMPHGVNPFSGTGWDWVPSMGVHVAVGDQPSRETVHQVCSGCSWPRDTCRHALCAAALLPQQIPASVSLRTASPSHCAQLRSRRHLVNTPVVDLGLPAPWRPGSPFRGAPLGPPCCLRQQPCFCWAGTAALWTRTSARLPCGASGPAPARK